MRWDNFTVVYGACTECFSMGTCGFYKALGPSALRLHTEATRAHRKALRTCSVHYGKIFPPQLLSPPYSK